MAAILQRFIEFLKKSSVLKSLRWGIKHAPALVRGINHCKLAVIFAKLTAHAIIHAAAIPLRIIHTAVPKLPCSGAGAVFASAWCLASAHEKIGISVFVSFHITYPFISISEYALHIPFTVYEKKKKAVH
jgi:hypothetical protein